MISCVVLERPGKWRTVSVTALLLVAVLPAVPLLWRAAVPMTSTPTFVGAAFRSALQNSARVAFVVTMVSLLVGLPTGVLTALYAFPGRSLLLVLVTLPLLVPSFLWAIGWSALGTR